MRQIFFFSLLITLILSQGCAFLQMNDDARYSQETFQDPRPPLSSMNEIIVGMPMNEVAQVWGEPWKVQVAGHPEKGNQRWIYTTTTSYYGLESGARIIYFENGQVSGWETRDQRSF